MSSFTVMHLDDFEHPWPQWRLARKSLGIRSFGLNVAEIEPGGQIKEHDETDRDQEEVFITLSGSPTLVIDGVEYPAPEGTFARVDPQPKRNVVNRGDTTARVLIVSAPTTSGYEPMEWA